MAKITRIKASDPREPKKDQPKKAKKTAAQGEKVVQKVTTKPAKPTKTEKAVKQIEKPKKQMPKVLAIITWPFRMIVKPFGILGRYIASSWQELRQVRWPSPKATWKMTLAALLYTGLLIGIIMLLDILFTWLFNLLLS